MSTLTLPNGTVLTCVTRASCLARVKAIALRSFEYSQTRIEASTGKRADCTGWVSYVWDTPDSGPGIYLRAYNTASFVTQHVVRRIAWSDLMPGDVVGYLSPTSPGNGGHAAIWMGGDRRPDGNLHVRDHGSGWGPSDRWVKWNGSPDSWLAPKRPDGSAGLTPWRYVGIIESGGDEMFCRVGDTGPVVQAMQRLVIAAGGSVGTSGPDGVYGTGTSAGLAALVGGTGANYGPAEYAHLFAKLAEHVGPAGAEGPRGPEGPMGPAGPAGPPGPGLAAGDKVCSTVTAVEHPA